jgi:AraC-like DNA-binding protein
MIDHEMIQRFYRAAKIPLQLFDHSLLVCSYDSGGFVFNPAVHIIDCAINSGHPVCYTVSNEYLHCGLVRLRNSSEYLVVGPVLSFKCTRKQAQKIIAGLQPPAGKTEEFLHWINSIPLCDSQQFQGNLIFLDYILNGKTDQTVVRVPYQMSATSMILTEAEPFSIEHLDDLLEKKLVSSIEYGRPEILESLFDELDSHDGEVPGVSSDADRAFKDIFIFSTGVASRAALRGNLDFDTVNAMSDYYLKKIESFEGYRSIFLLLKQMFLDFAQKTARCRQPLTGSPIVRKILKEVSAHLYEKITATDISKLLGMNCSYLCRHFKRETGKTLSEYVNEVKTQEAQRLLTNTGMSIVQISGQLGYSSQNYFNTIFKKVAGMTPLEYKNQ